MYSNGTNVFALLDKNDLLIAAQIQIYEIWDARQYFILVIHLNKQNETIFRDFVLFSMSYSYKTYCPTVLDTLYNIQQLSKLQVIF